MTYKARRTRDLQGEVKAGTGISVTESVKPDGTKEYTITNGDPASAITVSGEGLSLIANVLMNTMAARMGWSDTTGALEWYDDNGDPFVKLKPTGEVLISDADDGAGFFIKQQAGDTNKLISGDVQIAESVIATGGVSLQTLANMANSATSGYFGFNCFMYNNIGYVFSNSWNWVFAPANNTYYESGESDYEIDGNIFGGAKILRGGYYLISTRLEIGLDATTDITDPLEINISVVHNNNRHDIYYYKTYACKLPNGADYGYFADATITTIVELNANDIVGFFANISDPNITGINMAGDDPVLSIQKIR